MTATTPTISMKCLPAALATPLICVAAPVSTAAGTSTLAPEYQLIDSTDTSPVGKMAPFETNRISTPITGQPRGQDRAATLQGNKQDLSNNGPHGADNRNIGSNAVDDSRDRLSATDGQDVAADDVADGVGDDVSAEKKPYYSSYLDAYPRPQSSTSYRTRYPQPASI